MSQQDLPFETKLRVFRRLQREERAAWAASHALPLEETDDVMESLERGAHFLEARQQARQVVAREFGLNAAQLRTIELEGVLQAWPLEAS